MAEPLPRHEPVPTEPFIAAGVTVALAGPLTRYSLRARDAAVLERVVAAKLPGAIGAMDSDIICLGPDEWMIRSSNTISMPDGSGQAVSVTDISERAVGISIEGPRAAELLLSGNPLDLEKFAVGRATRTIFDGVEIILLRSGPERFEIDVWRSFAPFVWGVLTKAAAEI